MLPNLQYAPAGFAQHTVDGDGTSFVRQNFPTPKRAVAFWFFIAARASVPKTTVNENRQPKFWKNKVRLAKESKISPPAGDAGDFQKLNESEFRGCIAARTYSGHQGRTLLFGQKISQEKI